MATALVVHPAERPLAGSVPIHGDPEIASCALALAALARGKSHLAGMPRSARTPGGGALDAVATLADDLRALGVTIDAATPTSWDVDGVGLGGLVAPRAPLDCPSPAVAAILLGLLSGRHFASTLVPATPLARVDLISVVAPLRVRGAVIGMAGSPAATVAELPLVVGPLPEGRALSPLEHASDDVDPLLKTALLFSGLDAEGPTLFREPTVSVDHTERMLAALEAPIRTTGPLLRLDPVVSAGARANGGGWPGFAMVVPGDLSAAAYVIAAAQVVAGSRVTVRGVSTNPSGSGFLELARDLGAGVAVAARGEELGEPVSDIDAWCAEPRAAMLGGEPLQRTGQALSAAIAIAAVAHGTTRIRPGPDGAKVLAALAPILGAFGVACAGTADGAVVVHGKAPPLEAADVDARNDPDLAMAASVLALAARAPIRVHRVDALAGRFPRFVATLRALGATIEVVSE
jgi:3-phosphoshikimate 1-carboxyvinyltransferase